MGTESFFSSTSWYYWTITCMFSDVYYDCLVDNQRYLGIIKLNYEESRLARSINLENRI